MLAQTGSFVTLGVSAHWNLLGDEVILEVVLKHECACMGVAV